MPSPDRASPLARQIHVRGTVQGVGFRPYVYRLARAHGLRGWVLNGDDGVRIHIEGDAPALDAFSRELPLAPPPAAEIDGLDVRPVEVLHCTGFEIRTSALEASPTTRIAVDLAVCDDCLRELFDPVDRRAGYPYINCTNCGPRFSIIRALPYDRRRTTMAAWPMCPACASQYRDPADRRFHAQPIACRQCGPDYELTRARPAGGGDAPAPLAGREAIASAAAQLRGGGIIAVKGIGGYHLVCDADNGEAVATLRQRKYRKDQAFAVMVHDVAMADATVRLDADARALLTSRARPIVLAPAQVELPGVAPDNRNLGVMLPYAPLHHLLFAAGAPPRLVVTSGNRASEPIAFDDADARRRLDGLADAFLIGQRGIARRVDDSVVSSGALGPMVLRRARGLAPGAVARIPSAGPLLAVGGDLKNSVTLVVDGHAYVSQHIGDLSHADALQAFTSAIHDLTSMYEVALADTVVVHDAHPQYASTVHATALGAARTVAVQHHRAHVASVLAEREALDTRVLGVALDGTGYGDDGAIWGGEFFIGSVRGGLERVAHLRRAVLPGGDAAARHPVQAAAGFLAAMDDVADLSAAPFHFPDRFRQATAVARSGLRTFPTTSAGRLFDTVAALVGFVRPVTFEGQAAMWLEHLARPAVLDSLRFPLPFTGGELDWGPALAAIIEARLRGVPPALVARAFHRSLAHGLAAAVRELCGEAIRIAVLSGGVFQNQLLLEDLRGALDGSGVELWTNRQVPANDGGLSLGQAALAARL